ncbi:MAG: hypothetical protein ACFFFB_25735 [Candidatus Heimdallarchaeota archaeon]
MNTGKKILLPLLICLITLCSFLTPTIGDITLGDSSFPLEKDESIRWKTVNATEPYYEEIEFIRFTATDVFNASINLNRYLIVNYTLEFYHNFAWIKKSLEDDNAFYLSYNFSLNYLNWSKVVFFEGYPLVIPIPINLTLVSNAIIEKTFLNATEISSNTLLLDYFNATTIEVVYNSEGISTSIEKKTNGTTIFKWELVKNDIIVIIPFGGYFIWFTLIGVVTFTYYEVRKLKKGAHH